MQTLPIYSQPIVEPFCYYQLKDNTTLRISFNSKDSYFMPDFNSEIQIILYTTLGEKGNFDVYTGTNIEVLSESEKYDYTMKFVMSARPLGSSEGGMSRMEMEALQALTVESYRTAMALTTDNDLQEFFNNFKYRYGNASIKFTKLRDDARERIFSAFLVLRHDNLVFKTNCLNLSMNLSEMTNPEANVYMLEPGVLFKYSEDSTTEGEIFEADFFRDEALKAELYEEYLQAIEDGTIPYIPPTTDQSEVPEYLPEKESMTNLQSLIWKKKTCNHMTIPRMENSSM